MMDFRICRCGTPLAEFEDMCVDCAWKRLQNKVMRQKSANVRNAGRPLKVWDDKENALTGDELNDFFGV